MTTLNKEKWHFISCFVSISESIINGLVKIHNYLSILIWWLNLIVESGGNLSFH